MDQQVEVEDLILEAWEKVRPKLESDPAELARRVARMHGASLSRPPRAWCLALRACDRRIDEWLGHGYATRDGPGEHEVVLDAKLLRRVCAPVVTPTGGLTAKEVAGALGRCAEDLYPARSKGKFSVRHISGLGGVHGPPVPILSHKGELDPSMTGLEMPDPVWGWTAQYRDSWARDGFEQTAVRVPVYLDRTRHFRDKSDLHQEHPAVDPPTKRYYYPLPRPEPDTVPYKWKDGKFVGYDWRAAQRNPRIREQYERHERRKARERELSKLRGRRMRQGRGSEQFRGWRWLCPACGEQVKALYLPMAFVNVLDGLMGETIEAVVEREAPRPPAQRLGGFACADCYRVRFFAPSNHAYWNAVIGYLTGGLLYGWEVKRPGWVRATRKRAYRPRVSARGPWRREQVRELLLRGWEYARIAAELGMKVQTVYVHAWRVFRQAGARGRKDWERRGRDVVARGQNVVAESVNVD